MAYGKGRFRKRTRKRFGKRKRTKGKIYKNGIPKKAFYGRADTLLEKVIVRLAKKEINKNRVNLIDRNYYYGQFDPVTNFFTGGRRIFYSGEILGLARIDKQDINFVANQPDADPMEASGPRQELDGDGAQQGGITSTEHGRRKGDMVKIKGFTVGLKAWLDRMPFDPDSDWFQTAANGSFVRTLPETIILRWRIVMVTDAQAPVDPAIQVHPTAVELLPLHSFGYSSSLDDIEKNATLLIKKRTLAKGSMSFNVRDQINKDKTMQRYFKMKTAITQKYLPADQNGRQSVSHRFYWVIRSNVPHMAGTQNIDYSQFAPRVHVCLKTHYYE